MHLFDPKNPPLAILVQLCSGLWQLIKHKENSAQSWQTAGIRRGLNHNSLTAQHQRRSKFFHSYSWGILHIPSLEFVSASPPCLGAKMILCLLQESFASHTKCLALSHRGIQEMSTAPPLLAHDDVAWPPIHSPASVCFSSALTPQVVLGSFVMLPPCLIFCSVIFRVCSYQMLLKN